jgi:hypothetical protein
MDSTLLKDRRCMVRRVAPWPVQQLLLQGRYQNITKHHHSRKISAEKKSQPCRLGFLDCGL